MMQRPRHVSLDDLVAHWLPCALELRCCCPGRGTRLVPLVPIANRDGGRQTLRAMLGRLRCPVCDARPAGIDLCETVIAPDRQSWSVGWRFSLPVPISERQPIRTNARGWRVAEPVDSWQPAAK